MSYQQALIRDLIQPSSNGLSDAQQVYRNNYLANGIRAFEIANPTTLCIIGPQNFRTLIIPFLQTYPKSTYDWADYGIELSSYVTHHPVSERFPYLSDIIELDRQILISQRDADKNCEENNFDLLQSMSPDLLTFVPATGLATLKSYFPLHLFAVLGHESPHSPDTRDELFTQIKNAVSNAINLESPRSFVVYRKSFKATVTEVTNPQLNAWSMVVQGASVHRVLSSFSEDQMAMSHWLQQAIEQRMILSVKKITKQQTSAE